MELGKYDLYQDVYWSTNQRTIPQHPQHVCLLRLLWFCSSTGCHLPSALSLLDSIGNMVQHGQEGSRRDCMQHGRQLAATSP